MINIDRQEALFLSKVLFHFDIDLQLQGEDEAIMRTLVEKLENSLTHDEDDHDDVSPPTDEDEPMKWDDIVKADYLHKLPCITVEAVATSFGEPGVQYEMDFERVGQTVDALFGELETDPLISNVIYVTRAERKEGEMLFVYEEMEDSYLLHSFRIVTRSPKGWQRLLLNEKTYKVVL